MRQPVCALLRQKQLAPDTVPEARRQASQASGALGVIPLGHVIPEERRDTGEQAENKP